MSGFIGLFILVYVMAQLFVRAAAEIVYEFRSGAAGGPGLGYRLFFSGLLALPAYFVIPSCRGETFREAAGFRKTLLVAILEIRLVRLHAVSLLPVS